jgi:CRISPR-associated protein Csb2
VPVDEATASGSDPKDYVPVNDPEGPKRGDYGEKLLAILPTLRTRKERYFPSTLVGDATCALIWPDADPGAHRAALERLCAQVIRIGHSRSLVRMWLIDQPPEPTLVPATGARRSCMLRCPTPGRLDSLQAAFAAGRRPDTAPWIGYAPPAPDAGPHGAFDARLLILRRISGDRLFLAQTTAWTDALRGALIAAADADPAVKALVSGHAADGQALQQPHAAYLPLAFVGDPHADGHLLGLGIALPHGLEADREHGLYRALATCLDAHGELTLTAGRAGAAGFAVEDRPAPPKALSSATWSRPHACWSTVTPIVLDRQPPRWHADHDAFIAEEIARACTRQGLPSPIDIAILPVSACLGAPPAKAFPPLPRRTDGGRRWHTHAVLTFAEPVAGPLVLGAGRYRGYGLCRPGDAR